jgi:hypothetical protein
VSDFYIYCIVRIRVVICLTALYMTLLKLDNVYDWMLIMWYWNERLYNSEYSINDIKLSVFIQGVPGGMCQISGECSLGKSIPM